MIKQYQVTIALALIALTSGSYVYAQLEQAVEQQSQEQVETQQTEKYPDGIYNEETITPEIIEEAKFNLKKNQDTYEITRRLDRIIEILESK